MNDKFLTLDEQKRRAIINSGFRNFSSFGYKKASMADIAQGAKVSKALLFHYFSTKKEFYTYLWNFTAEQTKKMIVQYGAVQEKDFFTAMEKGLKARMDLSRSWPSMATFAIKAYYETDCEVSDLVKEKKSPDSPISAEQLKQLYPDTHFKEGLDLEIMYRELFYVSEGYVLHESQKGEINVDKMESDYENFLRLWRKAFTEER